MSDGVFGKIIKPINLNEVKHPVTMVTAVFLFYFLLVYLVITNLISDTYRFVIGIIGIIGLLFLIRLLIVRTADSIDKRITKTLIDDPKKIEDKAAEDIEDIFNEEEGVSNNG